MGKKKASTETVQAAPEGTQFFGSGKRMDKGTQVRGAFEWSDGTRVCLRDGDASTIVRVPEQVGKYVAGFAPGEKIEIQRAATSGYLVNKLA